MRDDKARPDDMLTAIDRILAKTINGSTALQAYALLLVCDVHHLQILGEAARCLSQEFRQRYPDPVWAKAAGMRHILVHHYFEIDAEQIWRVVQHDLLPLRELVRTIL